MTKQVPGPHGLPIVGNLLDLANDEAPLRALERLAELYRPIYKFQRGKTKGLHCQFGGNGWRSFAMKVDS